MRQTSSDRATGGCCGKLGGGERWQRASFAAAIHAVISAFSWSCTLKFIWIFEIFYCEIKVDLPEPKGINMRNNGYYGRKKPLISWLWILFCGAVCTLLLRPLSISQSVILKIQQQESKQIVENKETGKKAIPINKHSSIISPFRVHCLCEFCQWKNYHSLCTHN